MALNRKYYRAPWDSRAKRKTWMFLVVLLVLLLIFFISLFFFDSVSNNSSGEVRLSIYFFLITFALFLVGINYILNMPIGYFIRNDSIVVRRLWFNKKIPFSEIQSVDYQENELEVKTPLIKHYYKYYRKEYTMGWFGYSGYLRTVTHGKMNSYCNRWEKFVIIETKDDYPYLLSPENRHEFIQDALKALREWKIQEKVCECPVCGVALKDMDHVCHRCGAEYMNVIKF